MPATFKYRRFLLYVACLAMLGLLGCLDYLTGYELGFFVFYSAPVGISAWRLGRWPAVGMSLVASLAWAVADSYAGAKYSRRFALYWNNGVHFASFIINAITIASIKTELDRRHQLDAELAAARQALRAMAEQLPSCPLCGKPHNRTCTVREVFPVSQLPPELASSLCTPCRTLSEASK